MTPSGGIETTADNAAAVAIAIAVSRVAVTGAVPIAISRVAVAGPIAAVTGPITIAVRRIGVPGPIAVAVRRVTVAVAAVVRPRSNRATDYRCPDRCRAPSAAAPTAPR